MFSAHSGSYAIDFKAIPIRSFLGSLGRNELTDGSLGKVEDDNDSHDAMVTIVLIELSKEHIHTIVLTTK